MPTTAYPSSSNTTLPGTINAADNAIVGPEKEPRATLKIESAGNFGRSAIAINAGVSGVQVRNLDVNCTGNKLGCAVKAYGSGTVISNVHVTGNGAVLYMGGEGSPEGTNGLTADLLYCNSGQTEWYCAGAFGDYKGHPVWTKNATIERFHFVNKKGPHCFRAEHSDHLTAGHKDKTLPELAGQPGPRGKGFAGWSVYTGPTAGGCAWAMNDGIEPHLIRLRIDGTLAIGPIHIWAGAHPDWRMKHPMIEHCAIKSLVFNLGTEDFIVQNCDVAYCSLTGEKQSTPTFPDVTGTFMNVNFATKPPVNGKVFYSNCKWAGKVVGKHGEA